MKTYLEVFLNADGEKASLITEKLLDLGFKTSFGQHDFVYCWKNDVTLNEVLRFIDSVQKKLKGTKAVLKFTTIS